MINCDFIIFNSCNHCIKVWISMSSRCFCFLNYIHELKTKLTFVSIERNIGLRSFKPVQIIGWWTDKYSFMNGKACIMEWITDIQNPGSDYMHICNINVDYEEVSMCHCNVGLIKINTLNLRTPICTVNCNTFPCIRTAAFLNTSSNEWTEELCPFREGFYWYGRQKKAGIFVLVILHK